jgi:hypothetical protein
MEKVVNYEDVYRKLKMIEQTMVTKAELNKALETIMIVSNEDTMKQIKNSEKDIKKGKVKKINSVKDLI